MWNLHLAGLVELLSGSWLVLLIGFGTGGLALAVGWTRLRRKAPPTNAPANSPAGAPADSPVRDPFTSARAGERRAAIRRGGHPVTVEMSDPDAKLPSQHGWVLDRSVGGLCLMAPNPAPVGSFWKVRPTDAPRTTPPARVEVKTCVSAEGQWKISCQFDKSPSYAVLLMFG